MSVTRTISYRMELCDVSLGHRTPNSNFTQTHCEPNFRCIKKLQECNGDVGVALEELLSDFLQIDPDNEDRGGTIKMNCEFGFTFFFDLLIQILLRNLTHGYFESHFESRIVPTLESKDNSAEEEMRNDEKMALESIYADAFRDE